MNIPLNTQYMQVIMEIPYRQSTQNHVPNNQKTKAHKTNHNTKMALVKAARDTKAKSKASLYVSNI